MRIKVKNTIFLTDYTRKVFYNYTNKSCSSTVKLCEVTGTNDSYLPLESDFMKHQYTVRRAYENNITYHGDRNR